MLLRVVIIESLERLQQIVQSNWKNTAKQITDCIIRNLEEFTEGKEQYDDITLIVIKL